MELISDHWMLVWITIFMTAGAVIDGIALKVHNIFTYPIIALGLLYWGYESWATGNASLILHSVGGMFFAGFLVLVPWIFRLVGAGDVKMYAGFGVWILPYREFGYLQTFEAFAISVMVGGVMGFAMMLWMRTLPVNIETMKEVVHDFQTAGSVGELRRRANARKPSLTLLPYGIPLAIGSIAYIWWQAYNGYLG